MLGYRIDQPLLQLACNINVAQEGFPLRHLGSSYYRPAAYRMCNSCLCSYSL